MMYDFFCNGYGPAGDFWFMTSHTLRGIRAQETRSKSGLVFARLDCGARPNF